jgi:2,4-dienoyl-CoA reductase-like NADH-dependent reductase (Old Yellow Enzyme family)
MTEMVCVSPQGRITPGCAGMYAPEHEAAWRRITGFVHGQTAARIGLQLGHSGRKGSTRLGAGADAIDVSTGQVTPDETPAFGRSYQTPFADAVRNRRVTGSPAGWRSGAPPAAGTWPTTGSATGFRPRAAPG